MQCARLQVHAHVRVLTACCACAQHAPASAQMLATVHFLVENLHSPLAAQQEITVVALMPTVHKPVLDHRR
jgi:hypothetical protein